MTVAPEPGPNSRRVELVLQIEEMRLLCNQQQTELPLKGKRDRVPGGIIAERLKRQAGILATLEFLRDHETEFRAWFAASRSTQPAGELS